MSEEQNPYRAAPEVRSRFELREYTDPSRGGRALSFALLLCAMGAATVPLGADLECVHNHHEPRCTLHTHRALTTTDTSLDVSQVDQVEWMTSGLHQSAVVGREFARSGPEIYEHPRNLDPSRAVLALPRDGLYYDGEARRWRWDGELLHAARVFFANTATRPFSVRERFARPQSLAACAAVILAPLVGLLLLFASERRTRALRLWIDPNARTARGLSRGLGGPTLDRTYTFGLDPRLQRTDHHGPMHLPMIRVASADGASLPLFSGHSAEHRAAFDRLVARANHALLHRGAIRSPSALVRFGPSALLLVAFVALLAGLAQHLASLPGTTGTIVLTNSLARCDYGGVTLLRGAEMQWSERAGAHEMSFTIPGTQGAHTVRFEVAPGQRTAFDCADIEHDPHVSDGWSDYPTHTVLPRGVSLGP